MMDVFAGRLWKTMYWIVALVVAPLVISRSTIFVVRWLVYVQFIVADDAGVMVTVSGVLIDLALQSIYFAALISITRRYTLSIVLTVYQLFMVFMFLRYGSPTLYTSVFGSFGYFGLY